jgi:hypothetical protein
MAIQHNTTVHVQRAKPIGIGRIRVKIAETKVNLTRLTHNGKTYETSRNLGRGRYVMKEASNE